MVLLGKVYVANPHMNTLLAAPHMIISIRLEADSSHLVEAKDSLVAAIRFRNTSKIPEATRERIKALR